MNVNTLNTSFRIPKDGGVIPTKCYASSQLFQHFLRFRIPKDGGVIPTKCYASSQLFQHFLRFRIPKDGGVIPTRGQTHSCRLG